jgi:hypothetical protein
MNLKSAVIFRVIGFIVFFIIMINNIFFKSFSDWKNVLMIAICIVLCSVYLFGIIRILKMRKIEKSNNV